MPYGAPLQDRRLPCEQPLQTVAARLSCGCCRLSCGCRRLPCGSTDHRLRTTAVRLLCGLPLQTNRRCHRFLGVKNFSHVNGVMGHIGSSNTARPAVQMQSRATADGNMWTDRHRLEKMRTKMNGDEVRLSAAFDIFGSSKKNVVVKAFASSEATHSGQDSRSNITSNNWIPTLQWKSSASKR